MCHYRQPRKLDLAALLEALAKPLGLCADVTADRHREFAAPTVAEGQDRYANPFPSDQPSFIGVIGIAELTRLLAMPGEKRKQLINLHHRAGLEILIIANGQALTAELAEHIEALGVLVLLSQQPCEQVISTLRSYLQRVFAPRTIVHGVFMEVIGRGVLIRGPSNIGKSELALDLIHRGHRLIADDAPEISRLGPTHLEGGCPELLRGFLEVRGLGVLNVAAMFGNNAIRLHKQLHLIVELMRATELPDDPEQRLWGIHCERQVLGVNMPTIVLPICPGSQLAVLVEAAVRNHHLRSHGYDAAADLVARQERLMNGNASCD